METTALVVGVQEGDSVRIKVRLNQKSMLSRLLDSDAPAYYRLTILNMDTISGHWRLACGAILSTKSYFLNVDPWVMLGSTHRIGAPLRYER